MGRCLACAAWLLLCLLAWSVSAGAQGQGPATPAQANPNPGVLLAPAAPPGQVPRLALAAEMFAQREQLQLRLRALRDEEQLLRREDAETHPLLLPVAMLIGGFAVSAGSFAFMAIAYLEPGSYLVSSREPPLVSTAAAPGLVGLAMVGAAVGATGVIMTNYRLRRRPHAPRRRAISDESQRLRRQLKQVYREIRREGWSLAPRLPALRVGFGVDASYVF